MTKEIDEKILKMGTETIYSYSDIVWTYENKNVILNDPLYFSSQTLMMIIEMKDRGII
jgi:hypothetical protein